MTSDICTCVLVCVYTCVVVPVHMSAVEEEEEERKSNEGCDHTRQWETVAALAVDHLETEVKAEITCLTVSSPTGTTRTSHTQASLLPIPLAPAAPSLLC